MNILILVTDAQFTFDSSWFTQETSSLPRTHMRLRHGLSTNLNSGRLCDGGRRDTRDEWCSSRQGFRGRRGGDDGRHRRRRDRLRCDDRLPGLLGNRLLVWCGRNQTPKMTDNEYPQSFDDELTCILLICCCFNCSGVSCFCCCLSCCCCCCVLMSAWALKYCS